MAPTAEVVPSELKILVVDDEPSVRMFLQEALSDEGYTVENADSGEQALERLNNHPFHLVLTDIRMPGISGMELTQKVKETWPETVVVIITSHASIDTAVEGIRLGVYDYLFKPVQDLGLLTSLTRRVHEKVRLEQENRRLVAELEAKNTELYALYHWGRQVSGTVELKDLCKTAVKGLSSLTGGRKAVMFTSEADNEHLTCQAIAPAAEITTRELPFDRKAIPRTVGSMLQDLSDQPIVDVLREHLGNKPDKVYPLSMNAEPYGLLVLLEDDTKTPTVSDGGLLQYVGQVNTSLANVLAHRKAAPEA